MSPETALVISSVIGAAGFVFGGMFGAWSSWRHHKRLEKQRLDTAHAIGARGQMMYLDLLGASNPPASSQEIRAFRYLHPFVVDPPEKATERTGSS